jgi:hypothetical protein
VAALLVGGIAFVLARDPLGSGDVPEPTSLPSVLRPSPHVEPTYDAVFDGDATGATDVTAELQAFLQSHDGQHVALAVDGIYAVTSVTFTASDLTVDFRGSRIQGIQRGVYGIFKIQSATNLIINDAHVVGTGYEWVGGEGNPDQWEHGIEINSGSNIILNNPLTRDTRGDGIYIGFEEGHEPSTGVVINQPDIERSARNGIAPVAGEVSILGGHVYNSGLHGIDFQVNNDKGAASVKGVVDGVDIRRVQDLPAVGFDGYAIAAGGYSSATKQSMIVRNVTGDLLNMTIRDTAEVTVTGNVSDVQAVADFPGSDLVTFSDNVRITRE